MRASGGAGPTVGARLRGRDAIRRLFATGDRARSGVLLARFAFSAGPPSVLRLGVAVGRGVRGAVTRNRCKRWMREAARHERERLTTPLDARGRAADVMLLWIDPLVSPRDSRFAETRASVRTIFETIAARIPS